MLICAYVHVIAILATKINLILILGDFKSFQNNFPDEIVSQYPKQVLL